MLPIILSGAYEAHDPKKILKQPILKRAKRGTKDGIEDVPFVDIDPGVYNDKLVKLRFYGKPKQKDSYQEERKHTYAEIQAMITHVYNLIERHYETGFEVLQYEPAFPKFVDLEEKRTIYRYSAYPNNPDGSPAIYPPHLEEIPPEDQVARTEIFNAIGLLETSLILRQVVPGQSGKHDQWVLRALGKFVTGDILDWALQGPKMEDYEEFNKNHRKSGTDIAQGDNLGHLPDWYSDRRFAEQCFTGTNPTTIEIVDPDLLKEFIAAAERVGDGYWAKQLPNIDANSLYVQDFRYLREAIGADPNEELSNREHEVDHWACASVSLFQLHNDGKLHPIAIVCDYKSSMADSVTIFNKRRGPNDPTNGERDDWPWRYAKTCAQVGDWIRHEVGVHLTRAHMIEEALIVATHRNIPMDHIVFKLLQPHWYKTLSLNAAARDTLVPMVVQVLIGLKPNYTSNYVRYEFENFDYVKNYVPNDLESRGFPNTTEGLADAKYKNYAYARNILSMWKCLRKYVMSMLEMAYDKNKDKADEMVRRDTFIQGWCREIQTDGWINTFPNIQTLDELGDAITMAIHIAAPFHTAINYLQSFYQAFVPSKPPALCQPLPNTIEELNAYGEKEVMQALPVGRQWEWVLAVQVPWLLSFKVASERSLIAFAQSQWSFSSGEIRDISKTLYEDLHDLKEEFVETSNGMDEDSVPYMVMDPDDTAVSILI